MVQNTHAETTVEVSTDEVRSYRKSYIAFYKGL